MEPVHWDHLLYDTIQHKDPNPALEAGTRMYNILNDFDMPEESCNACNERRYGEKLKANGRWWRVRERKKRGREYITQGTTCKLNVSN